MKVEVELSFVGLRSAVAEDGIDPLGLLCDLNPEVSFESRTRRRRDSDEETDQDDAKPTRA